MKNKFKILFGMMILAGCSHTPVGDSLAVIQIQDRNGLTETISAPERLQMYNQVDFLSAQPYKKVLRLYKQNGRSLSKICTYHPNGQVWQYLEAEELRAHGAYREWYPNGQLKIDAFVIGGTADVAPGAQGDWIFDGVCKVWSEQGKLTASIPYEKGDLEGISSYFYESGEIEKEVPYHKGAQEGESKEYHLNGKIRSKTNYQEGRKHGKSLGYFQNGQLAWDEQYRDELLLQGKYFSLQGDVLAEVIDGSGFRAVFHQDTLSFLVQIQQGFIEGGVKQFNPKGEIQGIYHVKNGKKTGEEVFYFSVKEAGKPMQPKLSVFWDDNVMHGSVKSWYSNGQLQSQREFCRNKKNGPSVAWYRDGSLMLVEEYEEDKLMKGQYYKKNALDFVSSVLNGTGVATLFDENGIFLRKISYVKGEIADPEKD